MARSNNSSYNTHMDLSDRAIIEKGLTNGSTKTAIAKTLGKDPSTICKEVKMHKILTHKCPYPLECASKNCPYGRKCTKECPEYVPFICKRRDKSPGVCNGCPNFTHCRMDKYVYKAEEAFNTYSETLTVSRQGADTTVDEVKHIGNILKPLLDQGQSIEQIFFTHEKEIGVCMKTVYNYIDNGVFKGCGVDITPMSLRRKITRKDRAKSSDKAKLKKREDRSYIKGRTWNDFINMINEEGVGNIKLVEMDTVYNDVSNGPFIQTFKFIDYGYLFCIYHEEKTAEAMNKGILLLEEAIGEDIFSQEVQVITTDRGSEFTRIHELETREDGTRRFRLYFCDPMCSHQKGSLENKHEELRYILPKEKDLRKLGLISQEKLNLAASHVNSAPRKKLGGKSPLECIEFLNPRMFNKFTEFGIAKIERDKVILKPELLK